MGTITVLTRRGFYRDLDETPMMEQLCYRIQREPDENPLGREIS